MRAHIKINGRSLCQHTGSSAGIDDHRKVNAALGRWCCCEHDASTVALSEALVWKREHPHHDVAVVFGGCPESKL